MTNPTSKKRSPRSPLDRRVRKIEDRLEKLFQIVLETFAGEKKEKMPADSNADPEEEHDTLVTRREKLLKMKVELEWVLTEIRKKWDLNIGDLISPEKEKVKRHLFHEKILRADAKRKTASIHLGWRHGIRAGMRFRIVSAPADGLRRIKGEIVVTRVQEGQSLCRIMKTVLETDPIAGGDSLFSARFLRLKSRESGMVYIGPASVEDPESHLKHAKQEYEDAKCGIFRVRINGLEKTIPSIEDLKADCEALIKQKDDLEWVLTRIQGGGIGFGPDPFPNIPKIDGSVVGVSNKINLVVISVGEEDGVKVGFEFTIYRGNTYVGKLIVEKVYPRQAACRVILNMTKGKVKTGDKVSTQGY